LWRRGDPGSQANPEGLERFQANDGGRARGSVSCASGIGIVGVGEASVDEIDLVNIRQATHLAMARAIRALSQAPVFALVDGNDAPALLPLRHPCRWRRPFGLHCGCFDHRQGDATIA